MAAVAPPSPEALTGALLALFSAGDLGKKLYSVLCRDIATVGKAQPFYQAERQEIQHLPRGACWREIRGEVRCAQKNTGPSRQSAGASACAGGVSTARVRPRPLGAPGDVGRRGEGCSCPHCHQSEPPRWEPPWAWLAGAGGCSGPEHLGRKPGSAAELRASKSRPSLEGKRAVVGAVSTHRVGMRGRGARGQLKGRGKRCLPAPA